MINVPILFHIWPFKILIFPCLVLRIFLWGCYRVKALHKHHFAVNWEKLQVLCNLWKCCLKMSILFDICFRSNKLISNIFLGKSTQGSYCWRWLYRNGGCCCSCWLATRYNSMYSSSTYFFFFFGWIFIYVAKFFAKLPLLHLIVIFHDIYSVLWFILYSCHQWSATHICVLILNL